MMSGSLPRCGMASTGSDYLVEVKLLLSLLAVLLCAAPALASDRSDQDLGRLGPPVMAVVAAGAWRLQVASAGGDDNDLLWAAWNDDATSGRIVRLVLLRQKAGKALPLWSTRREGGYDPVIEMIPAWEFGARPVLLFRYQIGAAYMRAELYGIGADEAATRLGEIEGSLIELLDVNGVEGLRVYDTADMRDPPRCLRWAAPARRLIRQSCNRADIGIRP